MVTSYGSAALVLSAPWTELAPQMLVAARVCDEPDYERMIQLLPWPQQGGWPLQKSWAKDVS